MDKAEYRTGWLKADVYEVQFTRSGPIDGELLRGILEKSRAELAGKQGIRVVVDTVLVANYSTDVREPASAILALWKSHGLQQLVLVVSSAPIRMIASTLCMIVGLKLKQFETRAEALAYIAQSTSQTTSPA